jgi:predicted acyl esterase
MFVRSQNSLNWGVLVTCIRFFLLFFLVLVLPLHVVAERVDLEQAIAEPMKTTPYPGGHWQPGPATFAEIVVSTWLPMDDGVELRVTVGYPADQATGSRAPGNFPVILQHSPYTDTPVRYFVEHGYIFVNVRARGTGESRGAIDFNGPRDRRDGVRIIDWVAKELDGSNGIVGMYGCSYPGQLALADAAAVGPNSPLKAVAALCAAGDYSHEIELAGGLATPGVTVLPRIAEAVGGQPETMAYFTALRDEILRGGDSAYHRDYWQERLLTGKSAADVVANDIPVLLWAGWEDVVEKADLEMYLNFQNAYAGRPVHEPMHRNQKVTARYQIILGEWGHGGGLDNGILLAWFDTWLKGKDTGIQETSTPMHLYEQSSDRWINTDLYPMVSNYTTLYLNSTRRLTPNSPASPISDSIRWADPNKGATLTYTAEPLLEGATLAGPISVTLNASSKNTNLELLGFLYDVAPDGTQREISNGVVLGSQRALDEGKTWYDEAGKLIYPYTLQERDDYLMPGKVYQFDIGLFPRQWSIEPGHSIRLTLTTQMPQAFCDAAYFGSEPCLLTKPQTMTLPGGRYVIENGFINLPLLPYGCFATAASAPTPTSNDVSMPLDWGMGYPAAPPASSESIGIGGCH